MSLPPRNRFPWVRIIVWFHVAITSIIGVEEDDDQDAVGFGNGDSDDSDAEMMLYESMRFDPSIPQRNEKRTSQ